MALFFKYMSHRVLIHQLVGLLVGQLVRRLVGLLVGWSVAWFSGRYSCDQSISPLVIWSLVGKLSVDPFNPYMSQLYLLKKPPTDRQSNRPTDRQTN